MKSILIIGMGRFGHYLCDKMVRLGNEVMIVDISEQAVEDMAQEVTSALIADCTKEDVLRSIGVANFDICFVCISNNFQNSLEITSMLKELGAKYVISKTNREIHAKFLLRNGADEIIHPDKDIADKVAVKYSFQNLFDYIELSEDYSIYEIKPLNEWVGKTVRQSDIRARYHISIVGIKQSKSGMKILPSAEHVIKESDHLMVIANNECIEKVLKRM